MPLPTEPGIYYWTPPNGAPRIVAIVRAYGTLMADVDPGSSWFTLLEAVKGEWGPRIPSPEQLEAMRRVAKMLPWDAIDHKGNIEVCLHCGVVWRADDSDEPPPHKPGCPWLRAQEKPPRDPGACPGCGGWPGGDGGMCPLCKAYPPRQEE